MSLKIQPLSPKGWEFNSKNWEGRTNLYIESRIDPIKAQWKTPILDGSSTLFIPEAASEVDLLNDPYDPSVAMFFDKEAPQTWREKWPRLARFISFICNLFSLTKDDNNDIKLPEEPKEPKEPEKPLSAISTHETEHIPQDERTIALIRQYIVPIRQRADSICYTSRKLHNVVEKDREENNKDPAFVNDPNIKASTLPTLIRQTESLMAICDALEQACLGKQWTIIKDLIEELVDCPAIDKSVLKEPHPEDAISSLRDDIILLEHFRKNFQK